MMPLLLIVLFLWLTAGFGRRMATRWLTLCDRPLERFVFSAAIGLGIIAYGTLTIGLFGMLSIVPVSLWLLFTAITGFSGMRENFEDVVSSVQQLKFSLKKGAFRSKEGITALLSLCLISICFLIALFACYLPPSANSWDSLSYHLAAPKIYLSNHRITLLPTQHHSNFPLTMEMLYTIGLLYSGYSLANLFHLLTTCILCLAILAFCRRFFTPTAGWIAVSLFISTPLVLWESSIAYIDLGLTLFLFLALYASVAYVEARRLSSISTLSCWISLSGVSMGFALGMKYLALAPMVFIGLFMLINRVPVKMIARYLAIALLIGSPWYVKNAVWLRNPVYPFAYSVFSGSKYWSEDRSKPYSKEHESFGAEHSLQKPGETALNLFMTPWNLIVQYQRPNQLIQPKLYTNVQNFTFTYLIGGASVGLCFSVIFIRRRPRVTGYLTLYISLMLLCWFFVSQHIRYLIPILPEVCILAGFSFSHSLELWEERKSRPLTMISFGAVSLQALMLMCGILFLPVRGKPAQEALSLGFAPTALSLPEIIEEFSHQGRDKQLRSSAANYPAIEWINENTGKNAGVVLFDDVFGYNLNRPYLWGDRGHSSYIPYDSLRSGRDLTSWFREHGIVYALCNFQGTAINGEPPPSDVLEVQSLLLSWYANRAVGKDWQFLIADGFRSGGWSVVYVKQGVAVVKMGETK